MEGRLLLKNCSVVRADGRVRGGMAVLVDGERILRVAPDEALPALPGDWVVPCRGRLVAPGLIDCHTHLVGHQLTPTTTEVLLGSRASRRARTQRLARALTPDELGALTEFGLARSLLTGVTTCVEHLDGAEAIVAALTAQQRAAERLGSRLVCSPALTNESSERAATDVADFAGRVRAHPLVRGALGFVSSSMIDDARLFRLGRMREELGIGAVFHLAEDEDDLAATYVESGRRIVPRLEAAGLLGAGVVGAFGRAIDRSDAERIAKSRTLVALSPLASLLEDPQPSGLEALIATANLIGLGSSSFGSIWEDVLTCHAALLTIARAGRLLDPDGQLAEVVLNGPAELVEMLFGIQVGAIEEGRAADLVVFGQLASEGETPARLSSGLLPQLTRARIDWVVCAGRVVVREGWLLGSDLLELEREANSALASVRSRAGAAA